jgi:hypothetical protein
MNKISRAYKKILEPSNKYLIYSNRRTRIIARKIW